MDLNDARADSVPITDGDIGLGRAEAGGMWPNGRECGTEGGVWNG